MTDFLQLLQAKEQAEREIAAALKKFTEATEHRVSSVSVSKLDTIDDIINYKDYRVEIEVRVAQ